MAAEEWRRVREERRVRDGSLPVMLGLGVRWRWPRWRNNPVGGGRRRPRWRSVVAFMLPWRRSSRRCVFVVPLARRRSRRRSVLMLILCTRRRPWRRGIFVVPPRRWLRRRRVALLRLLSRRPSLRILTICPRVLHIPSLLLLLLSRPRCRLIVLLILASETHDDAS